MLVGLAGPKNRSLDTLFVGTWISVKTPTYFLLAVEELEKVAMQQAAAWTASEKRRIEDTLCVDVIESHTDKRLRLEMQDGSGVHNQGEKKDSASMLVDLEGGGGHPTRIKKGLAVREGFLGLYLECAERMMGVHNGYRMRTASRGVR